MSGMMDGDINPNVGTRQYPGTAAPHLPFSGYDDGMEHDPIKIGRLIRVARRRAKLTQEQLAAKAGVSQSAITDIETGKRKTEAAKVSKLLRFFHLEHTVSADEHIDSSAVAAGFGSPPTIFPDGIPELESRAGMGGGSVVSVEVRAGNVAVDPIKPDQWFFPHGFIRDELHATPRGLIIVETQGDSMIPTLAPGERVFVDTNHTRPSPDGIYALRDQFGGLIVKRVHALAKKGLFSIISDNPAHPARHARGSDLDDEIIGRVVGAIKRL